MMDPSKLAAVELTLSECSELLAEAAPSPAVRELRVRYGALARVVAGWRLNPPHAAQLAAMLECTMELRAVVVRVCQPAVPAPTTLPGIGRASPRGRPRDRPRGHGARSVPHVRHRATCRRERRGRRRAGERATAERTIEC